MLYGGRIETAEWLIEYQCLGFTHQCGDDLDALLVAERQLLNVVFGPFGEAEGPLEVAAH